MLKHLAKEIVEALFFGVTGLMVLVSLIAVACAEAVGSPPWPTIPLLLSIGAHTCCYRRKWAWAFTLAVAAVGVFCFWAYLEPEWARSRALQTYDGS